MDDAILILEGTFDQQELASRDHLSDPTHLDQV
jgi:hypothetical protein